MLEPGEVERGIVGARVGELVLELARGVQRIDVDDHIAGAQDGGDGHQVLRQVGHHHRHARTALHAERLQPRAERLRHLVDVAEAHPRVHAGQRVA